MFTQPEADRLVQAATSALANGRTAQAASLLDEAIRADPRHPMALTKQAELAVNRRDHIRALALTDAALATEPNFAPAWHHRASACWLAGRQADAIQAASRAVAIQPPNPDFRLRLAQLAAWAGHGQQARDALAPLLAAEQDDRVHYAAAISMLGELAIAEARFKEANQRFDHALDLEPKLDVTRMQRGMNRLRLGQFRAGWADYAAREGIRELYPDGIPALAEQVWQGQTLDRKTLLVIDDQGHGDAIQFFRYMRLLRDRGAAHITWRSFPPLVRLLRGSAPYATVLSALPGGGQSPAAGSLDAGADPDTFAARRFAPAAPAEVRFPRAKFDYQCTSTSLPRWFQTELDSIPARVPYLRAPSQLKSALLLPPAKRRKAGRPIVGLAWSGDQRHTRDHLRSVPAEAFLSLAEAPGIRFHSLQHEVREADLPALNAHPAVCREVEKALDFADTAALIGRLDLVITVDTAIAHLAGAMGKPVWIVLHVAPDWRWLTERADSPWYPTARLFRVTQAEWLGAGGAPRAGSWRPVLDRIAAALRGFAAG